jgi:hypothetical protein
MRLPTDGQEYVRIQFTAYPTGVTAEASIDRTNWVSISVDANGLGLFLVRGPGSSQSQGTLVSSNCDVWVRVDGTPEQVVRKAGTITLE